MKFETIRLEEDGDVARLTLNRRDHGNAISAQMVEELEEAFYRLEDDPKARVLVLGAFGRAFSVGIDLRDFPKDSPPDVHGFSRWEKACRALERLPMVTMAAIDGECAGGGLQLALACDARVATTSSFFHLHEVRYGFLPGMGTFRLAKFVGLGRARRMALTGRRVEADEAAAMGFIDHLCQPSDLENTLAGAIAEFEESDVCSLAFLRRLMDESYEVAYEEFVGSFLAAQHAAVQGKAFRERIRRAHETNTPQGTAESE